MTKATPATTALQELKSACDYTYAAIGMLEHAKAPVFSAKVIAEQLFIMDGLPKPVREGIRAIIDNMSLARYLLETEIDELDLERERWKETLEKAAGDSHA